MTAPDLEQIKQRDTLADKAYGKAIALKTYYEAIALADKAREAYNEAIALAREAYEEATARDRAKP